jgi:hypothetical protein
MSTATRTKVSITGAKRKAETIREGHSKDSKKAKVDSVRGLKPRIESDRPVSNGRKEAQNINARATIGKGVRLQDQPDSSDDEYDGFDDDGGVALDDTEESLPTEQQGVHPDRVKANGLSAGPNGTVESANQRLRIYSNKIQEHHPEKLMQNKSS